MNTGFTALIWAVLCALLLLSGFFSAAETAFTGYSTARMKSLAKKKKRARTVLKMSENYNEVLITLLIGNNAVNILATSLATFLFTSSFGDAGVTLSTIVMTVLVLVFGEITPKTLARERPERFAMFACPLILFFNFLFKPFCKLFGLWKRALYKIFRFDRRPPITEEEFGIIVSDVTDAGILRREEGELIKNAMRVENMRVSAAMVPAERVTYVRTADDAEDVRSMFENSNYSRVPAAAEDLQHVEGVLYRTDFYKLRLCGKRDFSTCLKPVFKCKPTDKLFDVLKSMRKNRQHLALVYDGARMVGLLSVEDVLRELVGEIQDKYDAVPAERNAAGPELIDYNENEGESGG